jgi:hypothetical protein
MLPARPPFFLQASIAAAADVFADIESISEAEYAALFPLVTDADLFSFPYNALPELPLPVKREVKHEQVRRAGLRCTCVHSFRRQFGTPAAARAACPRCARQLRRCARQRRAAARQLSALRDCCVGCAASYVARLTALSRAGLAARAARNALGRHPRLRQRLRQRRCQG